eukprot:g25405.t1
MAVQVHWFGHQGAASLQPGPMGRRRSESRSYSYYSDSRSPSRDRRRRRRRSRRRHRGKRLSTVDRFIRENELNESAAARLRGATKEVRDACIDQGWNVIENARNASAVVISRIKKIEDGMRKKAERSRSRRSRSRRSRRSRSRRSPKRSGAGGDRDKKEKGEKGDEAKDGDASNTKGGRKKRRPGLASRAVGFYAQGSETKVMVEFLDDPKLLPWRPADGDAGPHGLGRDGWLVELHAGQVREWLLVDKPASTATVRDLCKAVSARLPDLGFRAKRSWLATVQDCEKCSSDLELGHELLRDLRWTQSECLELREVNVCRRQPPWVDPEEMEPSQSGASQPLVLMQRHTTRSRPRHESPGRRPAGQTLDSEVPHTRRLLLTSRGVRQFEYHPVRPGTLLVGKKDGTAGIIDYNSDEMTHSCAVDQFPILGLSWFHTLPQWAAVGGSQAGVIRFLRYDEGHPGTMHSVELEPFQHLSSLSMSCTDDFFMTSGFCIDVGLYDVITGLLQPLHPMLLRSNTASCIVSCNFHFILQDVASKHSGTSIRTL